MLSTTDRLLSLIEHGKGDMASGPPLDMDNLLLRQSLDVIGLVGFEQDMGATSSLDSSSQASNCLAVTIPAMVEVESRFREPFRARKFWRKVSVVMNPECIQASQTKLTALLPLLNQCLHASPLK